jgi:hypothetical protein
MVDSTQYRKHAIKKTTSRIFTLSDFTGIPCLEQVSDESL